MPREQRQQVVESDGLPQPAPLPKRPLGMRITPWPSKMRLLNPSKSMANLFFQKEIVSLKMSYFDSSRSVHAVHLEQVVAETEPS